MVLINHLNFMPDYGYFGFGLRYQYPINLNDRGFDLLLGDDKEGGANVIKGVLIRLGSVNN